MGKFGLGYLAQMVVGPLNGVGGVDRSVHLQRILEIGAEIGPVGPPGTGDFSVFLVSPLHKSVQSIQGYLLVRSGVGCLQISHKGPYILVGNIFAGIA